jgi:hypothetical protein
VSEPQPPARSGLRIVNALLFSCFAAVGFGLVARPALLFVRSQGILHAVLPWDVPLGRIFFLVALGLVIETARLGLALTSGRSLRARDRVALLLLVLVALGARSQAGSPLPPISPVPRLISALRTTAGALDRDYPTAAKYQPDAAALDSALAQLGGSGFVYRGHEVALHVTILEATTYAQLEARPGDLPGTLYIALGAERHRAFLSALTLDERGEVTLLRNPGGKPLLVEARFGTHNAPGRDPLMPEYPGMESVTGKKKDGPL